MSSTNNSPAQHELGDLFRHGSEDRRSTPSRGNTTIPEQEDSDDDVVINPRNQTKPEERNIEELSPEELSTLIQDVGGGVQAARTITLREINGLTFCEIVRSVEGPAALHEDFGIQDRIARIRLISIVKNNSQEHERSLKNNQSDKKAPEFPHKQKALADMAELKRYGVAIKGWLSLQSKRVAKAAEIIFKDPRVDLTLIASRLTDKEAKVDAIWANEIMRLANAKTMAYIDHKDRHTLRGEHSGLQIIKTLGTIIKGRSTRKIIKLTEEFSNIEPVKH